MGMANGIGRLKLTGQERSPVLGTFLGGMGRERREGFRVG